MYFLTYTVAVGCGKKKWNELLQEFCDLTRSLDAKVAHSSADKFPPPTYVKIRQNAAKFELFILLRLSFQIWEEYHKQKEVIAATIPSAVYDVIYSRSVQFPIVSLPSSGSYTGTIELWN